LKYLVITMRKPEFDGTVVPAHWEFLEDLRTRGILEQAGGFTDKSGGAYVITAADLAAAREVAHKDPLHLKGCSEVTVREWDAR
jgi:uncharacterized protein YciI